ncbi:putative neutral sphingomyelinase [Chionoecetes opilio]|uniref:sphingomyelin phosphodiesterase n=1 Tax=Chionoecetes opilio TaxID=41210 RepID=A0A8J4YB18_CHIOP|nr:putative neutral sphingomyelinase [Chionoecetes opilio]
MPPVGASWRTNKLHLPPVLASLWWPVVRGSVRQLQADDCPRACPEGLQHGGGGEGAHAQCLVSRGIPGFSKDREARVEAIIQQLAAGNEEYDFVFLQEVWSKADYHLIASKVNKVLPYSHNFYSGCVGSGLCVLSRSPITEVHYHRFALNGYPHKLLHGDWWGGKGVALCRTSRHGVPILLANTHVVCPFNLLSVGNKDLDSDDNVGVIHCFL